MSGCGEDLKQNTQIFQKKLVIDIRAYYDRKTILVGYNYIGMSSFLSKVYLDYGPISQIIL